MAETVQGPRSTANTRVNPQPGQETDPADGARPTEAQLRAAMKDNPGQRADNIERIIAKGDSTRDTTPTWPTQVLGDDTQAGNVATSPSGDIGIKPTESQVRKAAESFPVGQRADSADRIIAKGDSHKDSTPVSPTAVIAPGGEPEKPERIAETAPGKPKTGRKAARKAATRKTAAKGKSK